ncbi:hypothetical protein Tco_0411509 [Tanacetum coccineum]
MPYPTSLDMAYRPVSRLYKQTTLNSVLAYSTLSSIRRIQFTEYSVRSEFIQFLANLLQVNMDDPSITMKEYIRIEEEKARRHGKVYNWETATYVTLHVTHSVSSLNNEIDFRISFDEFDDEDYTDNDDDKVNIEHSSGDLSVKPLPDVINTDVGAYAHGSNKLLETSHD